MPKAHKTKKSAKRSDGPMTTLQELEKKENEKMLNEDAVDETTSILDKLNSQDAEEREAGCKDIAYLVSESNENCDIFWTDPQFLKKLTQNLCDPEIEVRIAAGGALRNLSLIGGEEVSKKLIEADCMTPIGAMLLKTYQSIEAKTGENISHMYTLLIQIVSFLCNLCENSEKAMDMFTNSKSILWVISFLQKPTFPVELKIATAQLVQVVTEDNPTLVAQITESKEIISFFQKVMTSNEDTINFKILIGAIVYNIRNVNNRTDIVKTLLPIISNLLDFDGVSSLAKLEPQIQAMNNKKEEIVLNHNEEVNEEYNNWKISIQAQKLSLELLTNICSEDPLDEERMEDENAAINIPQDIINLVQSSGIAQKVLPKCSQVPKEFVEKMKLYKDVKLESLFEIQVMSLSCLGNLLLMFPKIDNAEVIWNSLFGIYEENSIELIESITSVLWILSKKITPFSFTPTAPQVQLLFHLSKSGPGTSEDIRASSVGVLGVLGQNQFFENHLNDLCILFLSCLGDNSTEVALESLNSIFDVFAEPNVNQIVVKVGMMDKLLQCHQQIKQMLKSKTISNDLLERLDEAETNLGNFIEYKRAQFK